MIQTYTDRIFHFLAYVLSQPKKCKDCSGLGYHVVEQKYNGKKVKYYNTCKGCEGACELPVEQWVHLDALTKDNNRPQFIVAVKRFIDDHPTGKDVEFNIDYTKIRRI